MFHCFLIFTCACRLVKQILKSGHYCGRCLTSLTIPISPFGKWIAFQSSIAARPIEDVETVQYLLYTVLMLKFIPLFARPSCIRNVDCNLLLERLVRHDWKQQDRRDCLTQGFAFRFVLDFPEKVRGLTDM